MDNTNKSRGKIDMMAEPGIIRLESDQPFDLYMTLSCGQAFRWEMHEGWWYGTVRDQVIRIRQEGDLVLYSWVDESSVREYFQLDTDLEEILLSISTDPVMERAVDNLRGLRLVKQDPWECLLGQLCVTRNRRTGTRDRITRIAETLGESVTMGDTSYALLPTPEMIIDKGLPALKSCNLGYVTINIFQAAETVAGEEDWEERIRALPYEEARLELSQMKGVQPHLADWLLLFGFQKYEAFPVDAHIRTMFRNSYMQDYHMRGVSMSKIDQDIRNEARRRFGKYAGYAFEYLFGIRDEI